MISVFNDIVSAAGWNIVECEQMIEIHQGATSMGEAINETVSTAGQNEIFYRKPLTQCQQFAKIKLFRHNDEIHSYYIVLSYKLKPIFTVKKS